MTAWDSKVAIVTGGGRGIGLEIGSCLAAAGCAVALVDVNPLVVQIAAETLKEKNIRTAAMTADVSDKAQVSAVIEEVLNTWQRIDILVNNAGICPITDFEMISPAEWDRVLAVNLKGTFLFSQAVVPAMRKQKSGKIVNIASSAGQMGGIAVGMHYTASKAAILGLTKSLARVLAPHIQVNAVSPGTTESEMTAGWDEGAIQRIVNQIPAGRLGQPKDVAQAVCFLASDEANFITGQTLSVNGGLLMS